MGNERTGHAANDSQKINYCENVFNDDNWGLNMTYVKQNIIEYNINGKINEY